MRERVDRSRLKDRFQTGGGALPQGVALCIWRVTSRAGERSAGFHSCGRARTRAGEGVDSTVCMAPSRGDPDGDNLVLLSLDASSDVPVIEQLRAPLSKNMLKVLDIFKDWDDDENGMVSKTEFRKALPMLGLKVERSIAEELFDSFDSDRREKSITRS